ncbi:hypothetical protein SUGI_0150070 [Cryptomeria japonica]|nr:hypothetical protein SUGI_0150070 [Cryptomeria japonica]
MDIEVVIRQEGGGRVAEIVNPKRRITRRLSVELAKQAGDYADDRRDGGVVSPSRRGVASKKAGGRRRQHFENGDSRRN